MIADIVTKVQGVLAQNSSAILTATGVVGTVGTAVLTGRATFRAAEILHVEEQDRIHVAREDDPDAKIIEIEMLTKVEKVQMTWPLFLPPIAMGGGTIAAIIMANRISAKKAAALAAAYSLTEGQFQEYKEKALERLGVNKEKQLRDDIAKDRIAKHPNKEVIIVANGEVLFYDMLTGRYFQSTVEKVNKAGLHVQSEIYNYMSCSLSEFFDQLGLPATDYTDMVGWNSETIPKIDFSTQMTPDDRPCMTLTLLPAPKPDYDYRPY